MVGLSLGARPRDRALCPTLARDARPIRTEAKARNVGKVNGVALGSSKSETRAIRQLRDRDGADRFGVDVKLLGIAEQVHLVQVKAGCGEGAPTLERHDDIHLALIAKAVDHSHKRSIGR